MNLWTFCTCEINESGKDSKTENNKIFDEFYLNSVDLKKFHLNKKELPKVSLKKNRNLKKKKET
jgi:hypothetical protein